MCVNNLPKVATQWNSGATRDLNRGRRVLIPSALTTTPPSHTIVHEFVKIQFLTNVDISTLQSFYMFKYTNIRQKKAEIFMRYSEMPSVTLCYRNTAHRHLAKCSKISPITCTVHAAVTADLLNSHNSWRLYLNSVKKESEHTISCRAVPNSRFYYSAE